MRRQHGVPGDSQESNEAHANIDTGPGSGGIYTRRWAGTSSILLITVIVKSEKFILFREFCLGMEAPNTDSAKPMEHRVTVPTKYRKLSNTLTVKFQDTRPNRG